MNDLISGLQEIFVNIFKQKYDYNKDTKDIINSLSISNKKENGDIVFTCFKFSKLLDKVPFKIANELKEELLKYNLEYVKKIEVINAYINIYVDFSYITKKEINRILNITKVECMKNENNCKKVIFDFSSPNIAKPFHLGHFRNTILGKSLSNIYKFMGYNVTKINYLGDYGRQFGLLIEGYKLFKDDYDFESSPIDALSSLYVRINKLAKEDEKVMDRARLNFKKLEQKDEEMIKLWEYFKSESLKEFDKIYKLLDVTFDLYNGEAYYSDKMGEVISKLEEKHVLKSSNGAKVVELKNDETPCIIVKSDNSSIYATRDLAAIIDRARVYDFDKAIYITGYEQIGHFKQIFEVANYLVDEKYVKGLTHISYGLIRLKEGKMSSRLGNVIYTAPLIDESIKKAKEIIKNKDLKLESDKIDILSKQIGIGALVFNTLKQSKIKDIVFSIEDTLRFDGETGPYIQYTYVRIKSILNKINYNILDRLDSIDYSVLSSELEVQIIKDILEFENVLNKVINENEPAILCRYLLEISKSFSSMYNLTKIIDENNKKQEAQIALLYTLQQIISKSMQLLGIDCPEKM